MDRFGGRSPLEPSVLGAMWRHRWLVLAIVAVGTALGFFIGGSQTVDYRAEASVVLRDRSSTLLGRDSQNAQQHVATQVAVIESGALAQRAVDALGDRITVESFLASRSVDASEDGNSVSITFVATEPMLAVDAANALVTAYESFAEEESAAAYSSALAELDQLIEEEARELGALQAEIEGRLVAARADSLLNDEFESAIVRFQSLQAELATLLAERPDVAEAVETFQAAQSELDAIDAAIERSRLALEDVRRDFQTITLANAADAVDPGLEALLAQQDEAIRRSSSLIERRDAFLVDAGLESSSVLLRSAATEAEAVSVGLERILLIALVLAGIIAAAVSYLLALRRETFDHRLEPEPVLGAPFLAEIPELRSDAEVKSALPVSDSPASASAEAFRFLVTAVEGRFALNGHGVEIDPNGEPATHSIAFVSAGDHDDKSVVVANMALAAAGSGYRVLVIDADVAQELSQLLATETAAFGLGDVITGDAEISQAVTSVMHGAGSIDIIALGKSEKFSPELLRTADAAAHIRRLLESYDLSLVDAPPILRAAYASHLIRYASRALIVVPDGGAIAVQQDVQDRLALTGTPALGYVYTRAPLRSESMYGSRP